MKNLKPKEIADKLKELTSVDVFENTRTQQVVKIRSLLDCNKSVFSTQQ